MAWSAPSEWERWDPDKLLVCPYDQLHRVPAKRYQYHVIKCREKYPEKDFVSCPFNAKHIMLRPELRQHIVRCLDRSEIEPYSYKGNEKDSEGFYFKGDTSVPCYKRETAPRTQEEDWDREDEETTSRQNLCEYYANRASLPAQEGPATQDVLSLNPSDREQFKRSMRTQAIQNYQCPQHNQLNRQHLPQQPLAYNSSFNHWEYCEGESTDRLRNGETGIRKVVAQNIASNNKLPHNSNHYNYNRMTDNVGNAQNINFNSEGKEGNEIAGYLDQDFTLESQEKHRISANTVMSSRTHSNGFSAEGHQAQGSRYPGTSYSYQNNSHLDVTVDESDHMSGVNRLDMRGVINGTQKPSLRGAGRATLAEEARRMNFGLRRSGAPLGRGRGILDLYGYQG